MAVFNSIIFMNMKFEEIYFVIFMYELLVNIS